MYYCTQHVVDISVQKETTGSTEFKQILSFLTHFCRCLTLQCDAQQNNSHRGVVAMKPSFLLHHLTVVMHSNSQSTVPEAVWKGFAQTCVVGGNHVLNVAATIFTYSIADDLVCALSVTGAAAVHAHGTCGVRRVENPTALLCTRVGSADALTYLPSTSPAERVSAARVERW